MNSRAFIYFFVINKHVSSISFRSPLRCDCGRFAPTIPPVRCVLSKLANRSSGDFRRFRSNLLYRLSRLQAVWIDIATLTIYRMAEHPNTRTPEYKNRLNAIQTKFILCRLAPRSCCYLFLFIVLVYIHTEMPERLCLVFRKPNKNILCTQRRILSSLSYACVFVRYDYLVFADCALYLSLRSRATDPNNQTKQKR